LTIDALEVARNSEGESFEMFWFRLIVVGGFGLLGLLAAVASIAQGLHP
jgi:hypothetical protein